MEQLFEFAGNHLLLVSAFFVILIAIVFQENKKGGKGIGVQEATRLINKEGAQIVDLRSKQEYSKGHILDALNIPYMNLQSKLPELEKAKEKPVILVCKMGQHSRAAYKVLEKEGFTNVLRLTGGMTEWTAANLPLTKS